MYKDIFRLLGKCSIFAIPFIPLNIYLYSTSEYYEKQESYHATIENFFLSPNVKNLIIGDSHPGTLTNDMLNEETYNIAFGGDGLKENYLKLKYVLNQPNQVEHLFLTADAQMFGARRVQSSNYAFLNKYVLDMGEYDVYGHNAVSILADMVPLFSDSYIDFLNKQLSDNVSGQVKTRNLYTQLRADHSMWSTQIPAEQRLEFAQKTGISDHRGVLEDSIQVSYYHKMVELCKEKGVKIIGVKYPAMQEYLAGLPTDKQSKLDSLFSEVGFYAMLDYRNFSQDPRLFKNEDHVNDDGARLLIKEMERDTGLNLGKDLAMN